MILLHIPHSALFLCLSWLRGREDRISTHLSVWAGLQGLLPMAKVQDFRSESLMLHKSTSEKQDDVSVKHSFMRRTKDAMATVKTISAPLSSCQKMLGGFVAVLEAFRVASASMLDGPPLKTPTHRGWIAEEFGTDMHVFWTAYSKEELEMLSTGLLNQYCGWRLFLN